MKAFCDHIFVFLYNTVTHFSIRSDDIGDLIGMCTV